MPPTRATLLQRIRCDDRASWEEFYAVYHGFLSRYATMQGVPAHEVPDVVQEIFSKLYRARQRFEYDPQRARFRTWLLRVARNQVIDWRRNRSRCREQCGDVPEYAQPRVAAEVIDWAAESRVRVLEYALERVRSDCRELTWLCFSQHHLRGRTAPEIAAETGLTVNGVYTNAARVLDRVRQKCLELDEDLDDESIDALS